LTIEKILLTTSAFVPISTLNKPKTLLQQNKQTRNKNISEYLIKTFVSI
jgi:hypothetical protein